MIIKSKPRKTKSFKQLLQYLLHDKGRTNPENIPFVVTHNIQGEKVEDWVHEFQANEKHRKRLQKNSTKVIHEIVSFHKRDSKHLTHEKLYDIAEKYIQERNSNGMYIVIPHIHDNHLHFHLCGSPLEYLSGKSLRLSKKEFADFKIRLQTWQRQKYPELSHSIVKHGRGIKKDTRIEQKPQKKELTQEFLRLQTRASNEEELHRLLEKRGYKLYSRRGKVLGVRIGKWKFPFHSLSIEKQREKSQTLERNRER